MVQPETVHDDLPLAAGPRAADGSARVPLVMNKRRNQGRWEVPKRFCPPQDPPPAKGALRPAVANVVRIMTSELRRKLDGDVHRSGPQARPEGPSPVPGPFGASSLRPAGEPRACSASRPSPGPWPFLSLDTDLPTLKAADPDVRCALRSKAPTGTESWAYVRITALATRLNRPPAAEVGVEKRIAVLWSLACEYP